MKKFGKKVLATVVATTMALGLAACGGASGSGDSSDSGSGDTAATSDSGASSGEKIKVGIINNDPNESGYRTANDKDLKAMF